MTILTKTKSSILLIIPCVLLGCSTSDGGPSPHTVKQAIAEKIYMTAMSMGPEVSQYPSLGSWETPGQKKEYAEYEKLVKHKSSWFKRAESSLHNVTCNKVSAGKFDCSVRGEKNKQITLQMQRYGHAWRLTSIA